MKLREKKTSSSSTRTKYYYLVRLTLTTAGFYLLLLGMIYTAFFSCPVEGPLRRALRRTRHVEPDHMAMHACMWTYYMRKLLAKHELDGGWMEKKHDG